MHPKTLNLIPMGAAFQQPHLSDRYSETQHLNQTHVLIIKLGFTRVARFQTESNLKVKWNVWCFWLEDLYAISIVIVIQSLDPYNQMRFLWV